MTALALWSGLGIWEGRGSFDTDTSVSTSRSADLLSAAVLAFAALAVRWRFALPRPILADVGSSGLVAIGLSWFVGRS